MASRKQVSFGVVRVREYVRTLSSGGIPESEGGCKFPLGLSNVVLVRDESGEIVHGVDVVAGGQVPLEALGVTTSLTPTEHVDQTSSGSVSNTSSHIESSGVASGQSQGSHIGTGASNTESNGAGNNGGLKLGERILGGVDECDAAAQAAKAVKLADLLRGKSGKRVMSAAILAALLAKGPAQWHCDAKDRQRKLTEQPCLVPGSELASEAERLSAEYSAICKHRAESNAGCRCGALSNAELQACKKEDLMRECKLRGLATAGGKKTLVARLVDHSRAHLGCTSRMHAMLDKLEAMEATARARSSPTGSAEASPRGDAPSAGAGAGAASGHEGHAHEHAQGGERMGASSPQSTTSSDSSSVSLRSMSETRELEVNARLQRLADTLPNGMRLPDDPRQRKAFVRALLLAEDVQQDTAAALQGGTGAGSASSEPANPVAKLLTCPCEAEGIGCHYNTCLCDPDMCDNRHLWDPSSAVYADRLFELHRAAVHFLNASWMASWGNGPSGAGSGGGGSPDKEKQDGKMQGQEDSGEAEGNASAPEVAGAGGVVAGIVSSESTAYLHLPGGHTFALPGGMLREGPFFSAEQVVWTMKLVENLVQSEEAEEEEREGAGAGGATAAAMSVGMAIADAAAEAAAAALGVRGGLRSGGLAADGSTVEAVDMQVDLIGDMMSDGEGDALSVSTTGSATEEEGEGGGRRRGGRSKRRRASAGAAEAGEGAEGASGFKRGRKRKSTGSDSDDAGSGHFHSHVHGHGAHIGVSELEWSFLHAIYGAEQLAALGPAGADRATFPVAASPDGVLSVWRNVTAMPVPALSRLASKPVRTATDGWLSSLSWMWQLHKEGKLKECMQAAAEGTAVEGVPSLELVTRLQSHFKPAEGAAVLRALLSTIAGDPHGAAVAGTTGAAGAGAGLPLALPDGTTHVSTGHVSSAAAGGAGVSLPGSSGTAFDAEARAHILALMISNTDGEEGAEEGEGEEEQQHGQGGSVAVGASGPVDGHGAPVALSMSIENTKEGEGGSPRVGSPAKRRKVEAQAGSPPAALS